MTKRSTLALSLAASFLFALGGARAAHAQHDQHAGHAQPAKAPAKAKRTRPAPRATKRAAARYVCPMHPEVTSTRPGLCPKCNMKLRPAPAQAAPKAAGEGQPAAGAAAPAAGVAALGEAPKIPDLPVVDQDGRELKFYTDLVKGKTVAINFIFTTCTTVCPPMTAVFRRVQQELGERAGRDVELISVSVDPATDTPARLKSFSQKFKAGPGWTFVTGGVPEINSLLRALGAGVNDKNDHTPTVLVGNDAAGHWTRAYGLAPAATLVKVIDDAAARGGATAAKAGGAPAVPAAEKLAADGDKSASAAYFPNHVLVTQEGRPVRFYDDLLKGKIVLINFMFTTCAGVCSPMTANMAKVQSQLGDRVGKEVVMISISVDPSVDTPDVLRKYAGKFKAGPGWYFLTGKKENVDWVLYKLGGFVDDKAKHTAVLLIGNESTGEWVKTAAMKSPAKITGAVLELLKAEKK